jgi:hypothetical protein
VNDEKRPRSFRRVAAAAMALGLAAGAYGIGAAASGSGGTTTAASGTTTLQQTAAPATPGPGGARQPWGGQRSDETPLTGNALTRVRQAALTRLPGATVERIETDADGHAAYEAHVVKSDGTPATVYVDEQFAVVSVETR